jgi:hypothetical protein
MEDKKLLGRHWPGDEEIMIKRDFTEWVERALTGLSRLWTGTRGGPL